MLKSLKLTENRLVKAFSGMSFGTAVERYGGLTDRERQVANAIANGTRSRKIAEDLGISPKTLDIHRTNVLRKLNTKSIVVAARIVYMVRIAGKASSLCWVHDQSI